MQLHCGHNDRTEFICLSRASDNIVTVINKRCWLFLSVSNYASILDGLGVPIPIWVVKSCVWELAQLIWAWVRAWVFSLCERDEKCRLLGWRRHCPASVCSCRCRLLPGAVMLSAFLAESVQVTDDSWAVTTTILDKKQWAAKVGRLWEDRAKGAHVISKNISP